MSGDIVNNPDFQPVILGKKKPVEHTNTIKSSKIVTTSNGIDIHKLEEETVKLPTATYELKSALQKARMEKGLTQEKLNEQLSLPKGTVRDYENGKAVLNQQVLNKINRILGSKLRITK